MWECFSQKEMTHSLSKDKSESNWSIAVMVFLCNERRKMTGIGFKSINFPSGIARDRSWHLWFESFSGRLLQIPTVSTINHTSLHRLITAYVCVLPQAAGESKYWSCLILLITIESMQGKLTNWLQRQQHLTNMHSPQLTNRLSRVLNHLLRRSTQIRTGISRRCAYQSSSQSDEILCLLIGL